LSCHPSRRLVDLIPPWLSNTFSFLSLRSLTTSVSGTCATKQLFRVQGRFFLLGILFCLVAEVLFLVHGPLSPSPFKGRQIEVLRELNFLHLGGDLVALTSFLPPFFPLVFSEGHFPTQVFRRRWASLSPTEVPFSFLGWISSDFRLPDSGEPSSGAGRCLFFPGKTLLLFLFPCTR